jgi:hypothetical protein
MKGFTAFVFCFVIAATTIASAQAASEASPKASGQSAPDASTKAVAQSVQSAYDSPKRCYALNYVLKELDGSKVINQRSYVLNTFASNSPGGDWTRLRVGNRVPVFVHSQEKGSANTVTDFNYIDVGLNIDNRLREAGNALALEVTAEISSLAGESTGVGPPQTVRQVKGTVMSTIYPNKPSVVFSADDPGSQHRFELQVTATLVR